MKDHRKPKDLYRKISRTRDEDRDDSSSTDVDLEALDLNEKDYMHESATSWTGSSEKSTFLAILKEHRWLIDTFLLVVIVLLLLGGDFRRHGREHFFEGGGDLTGFAPEFGQKITKFSPDPSFVPENTSEFFSEETRKKWLSLVPKGLGYLEIKNPQEFDNLPAQLNSYPDQFVVTSSMTHQLHCLYAIAEAYSALTSDTSRVPQETPWHLTHCFDYLRQSIMCCGDVALEGEQTTFPEGFDGSDGWDAKHVCKNYGEVYDYLEKNRADDKVWI
ncbi:hypothetical protein F4813DRAFT_357866 [Daldinia decipiens]|uniref:uncharacterized protein n=1 Tax=Daldinia decipiens TaxID=326647 RepID=UPI0020C38E51|nr:uncharacterized protein F4813DRAFT_357866 [Daldinia decipiens]KAI1658255.1 hypothetical protein F4813DRAFT_357866 [Daldinia decipiens]